MKDFVKKATQKIDKLSSEQLEKLIDLLNEENDVLSSVIESLSTGLIIVNKNWEILQSNKAADRYLPLKSRLSDSKNEGVCICELIDDQYITAFLSNCIIEKETNAQEEFSIATEEKARFITITVMPMVMKKKISGFIITVDDITEKRQQEILLHRMESLASLTNLAASVAHEIKNPLGAISIHIQLLQKAVAKARNGSGELPAPKFMEDYLSVVNEEIDNLNKIVLDFLFAVRPVQANMMLTDPDELITHFVTFFRPEFEEKNIDVEVKLCNASPRLMLDEKLFREVITNMVQNALAAILSRFPIKDSLKVPDKGSSDGEKGILRIESLVKNDSYYVTVSDNGCGMDEKTASHIFEPYYTTKANGTGLGLTMVYKIIKEFRGDIDVKSVEGHGTVFTIRLPVPQKGTKLLQDKSGETK